MITSPFWWQFGIFRWQDGLEIALFTLSLYYFSLWLFQDKQKPLLLGFYGYCALFLGAQFLQLVTLSTLFITLAPLTLTVFILLHRDTLQKNFITLHRITPQELPTGDWIEDLVRAGLTAASNNSTFTCIVEKKDSLTTLLSCPAHLASPCTADLIKLITSSTIYHPEQMLWIDTHIKLASYNCTWKKNSVDAWLTEDVQEQEQWLKDALFFTSKTDALFIKLLPATRTFTLVAGGKIIEKVVAQQACSAIRTYLGYPPHSLKGDWYVPHGQNSTVTRIRS